MSASKVATLSAKDNFLKRYWSLLTGKAKAEAEGTVKRRGQHRDHYKKHRKLSPRQEKKYQNYRKHWAENEKKPAGDIFNVTRNNRAEWLNKRIGKAEEHFKTVADSTSKTRRNTAIGGAGALGVGVTATAIAKGRDKKKPRTSTKYTRYSEKMDDALIELGIARGARVAASKVKKGKGFMDYSKQEAAKLNYQTSQHGKRRAAFLRANPGDAQARMRGNMAEAALKALPKEYRKIYASMDAAEKKDFMRHIARIHSRVRSGDITARAQARGGEKMIRGELNAKMDEVFEFAMLGPNVDRRGRNKWDRAGLKTPGSGKKAKARSRFKHKGTHMQVTTASGKRIVLPMPGLPHMAIPAQIKAMRHNAKR